MIRSRPRQLTSPARALTRPGAPLQQDMDISSGGSTPTEEAAAAGALAEAAAPRLAGLTAVSLAAALPRLVQQTSRGDTPPPEDRGPPTPTLSEPQDTAERHTEREWRPRTGAGPARTPNGDAGLDGV